VRQRGDLCGVEAAKDVEEAALNSGVVVPPATAAAILGGILGKRRSTRIPCSKST
jgi:hypothetical protein